MEKRKELYKKIIAVMLLVVSILLCNFLPITLAWLQAQVSIMGKQSAIATAEAQLYNGKTGEQITSENPYTFTTGIGGNVQELDIWLKNSGTARIITRVFYSFLLEESQEIATSNTFENLTYGEDFIKHEHLPNVYSGYLFYDGAIETNTYVKLFDTVTPTIQGGGYQFS